MTIQDIESYEDRVQRGGAVALRRANEFFGLEDPVFKSFFAVTAKLNELGEPYVVGGQLAMTAYGCSGTTPEVQIFLTGDGLAKLQRDCSFETTDGVQFLMREICDIPTANKIDGIRFVRPEYLVETKLASANIGRMKDLSDESSKGKPNDPV